MAPRTGYKTRNIIGANNTLPNNNKARQNSTPPYDIAKLDIGKRPEGQQNVGKLKPIRDNQLTPMRDHLSYAGALTPVPLSQK